MKAAVMEKIGEIVMKDLPKPVPKDNEVLVNIKAVGICGSDIHLSGEGVWEAGKIFPVSLPRKLTSAKDYAEMILARAPIGVRVPEERFALTEDTIPLTPYFIDGEEVRTEAAISFVAQ